MNLRAMTIPGTYSDISEVALCLALYASRIEPKEPEIANCIRLAVSLMHELDFLRQHEQERLGLT